MLPNAHTDFIFSVIGEEVGLIGDLVVIALFGALRGSGCGRHAGARPLRGPLAVAASWLGHGQTVINVGAVVGVLPVTGIPLPFISFGGSSLVITMAAAGVLINVARQGEAGGALRIAGPDGAPAKSRGSAGHRTHGVHGVHGGHRSAVAASTRRPAGARGR